jgi:hypothetical protein
VANERPDSALGRLAAAPAALGEDVLDLARKGDEASVKVLKETGTWLGIGLATFVNIFDPEGRPFDLTVRSLSGRISSRVTSQGLRRCRVLWLLSECKRR